MVKQYQGHYPYSEDVVSGWQSSAIGVYYCGFLTAENKLRPVYIGVGTGDGGMRERLLCHLREDYWPDATHFGYHHCDSAQEALNWETQEILSHQPKYNEKGR